MKNIPAHTQTSTTTKLILISSFSVLVIQLVRVAWIDEDAYITFRSVLNFYSGEGPVWNLGERVQVYTHPLWFIVLSTAKYIGFGVINAAIFLGIAFSTLCLAVVTTLNQSNYLKVLLIILAINSKSFMEYSTSGLENSLSAILVCAIFFLTHRQRSINRLDSTLILTLFGLLLINRLDLVVLAAPAVAYYLFSRYRFNELIIPSLIGALPVIAWFSFSIIYYGHLFPNSYYAKLGTGIPASEMIPQGFHYFLDSLYLDPLTLLVITIASIAAFLSKSRLTIAWTIGIALYFSYVLKIGGDYMSGRFLMVPFTTALLCLAVSVRWTPKVAIATAFAALLIGLTSPSPIILNDNQQVHYKDGEHGIYNERSVWYSSNGFLAPGLPLLKTAEMMARWEPTPAKNILTLDAVGGFGILAGTENHLVDVWAICDPLLSRLPLTQGDKWHIGHFRRKMPDGYLESIANKSNRFKDKDIGELFELTQLVTRGEIWDEERWRAIWLLNTGRAAELSQNYSNPDYKHARYVYASVYKNRHLIKMLEARNNGDWGELEKLRNNANAITVIQNNSGI